MLRIFAVISLFVATLVAQAQSSGFLGKKFSVGYGLHASPALIGANAQNQSMIGNAGSAETGVLAFNLIHEGFLDYSISSKWIMGFSVRYYRTVYDNAMLVTQTHTKNYETRDGRPSGYYNINGLTYTLYFKYFGKRYVAPWGRYVMFGPAINTVKTQYSASIMNLDAVVIKNGIYGKDTTVSDFGHKTQMYKGVNLMMGYGRTRIIGKRITLDYGLNMHLFSVLSTLIDLSSENEVSLFSGHEVNSNDYIRYSVKNRIRGVNRVNAFLKIGVLLF